MRSTLRTPGCGRRSDRPWAMELNAFGVLRTHSYLECQRIPLSTLLTQPSARNYHAHLFWPSCANVVGTLRSAELAPKPCAVTDSSCQATLVDRSRNQSAHGVCGLHRTSRKDSPPSPSAPSSSVGPAPSLPSSWRLPPRRAPVCTTTTTSTTKSASAVLEKLSSHYAGLKIDVRSALLIDGEGIEIRGVANFRSRTLRSVCRACLLRRDCFGLRD